MEVRDEVVCLSAHPTKPLIAYGCRTRTRNPGVDKSVIHGIVKIWNYERNAFEFTLSESGDITCVRYSPDGGVLAVARSGDWRFTPATEDSLYRIALYNADDKYRLLKTDTDSITDLNSLHYSPITAIAFCHIDLGAGDKTSWGRTSVDIDAAAAAAARSVQRPWMVQRRKNIKPVLVRHVTILASGTEDGKVRIWDFVGNAWESFPVPPAAVTPSVMELGFTTDGRILAALLSNNTVAMWSFSASRPRQPPIDVQQLIRIKCDEYDAALTLRQMENKIKGITISAKKIQQDKNEAHKKIKIECESVTEILPPPAVPIIGHPNLFLRCVLPKDKRDRRTLRTLSVIPGFRAPSGYVADANDPNFIMSIDNTIPPPYPGAEIETKTVFVMVDRMRRGEDFSALFIVRAADLVVMEPAKTLRFGRVYPEQLTAPDPAAGEDGEGEGEGEGGEGGAKTGPGGRRGPPSRQSAAPKTAGVKKIEVAAGRDLTGTALRPGSDLTVISVAVHMEYIDPLPYPPEALKQVQQYNIDRYRLMLATNATTSDELPEEFAEPRSVATLAPLRHVLDPDPKWRKEQIEAEKKRIQPVERQFDVVGELLVRDLHREYLFPLADLVQIQVGKLSVEHLSAAGKINDPLRCFSLIGKYDQLHLVAPTRRILSEWITGIRHVLWRVGRHIAATEVSDQFLVDCPPPLDYLDFDVVHALSQSMSLGAAKLLQQTSERSSRARKEGAGGGVGGIGGLNDDDLSDDDLIDNTGMDNLDKIFATTCHSYRIFAAGEAFAGVLHVRVNHEAVYEYYCLDKTNRSRLPGQVISVAAPLELKPRVTISSKLTPSDMIRLMSVALGQHNVTELGDWSWMRISGRVHTPNICASAVCIDGKFLITAEQVLPPGLFNDDLENVDDDDDLFEINLDTSAGSDSAAATGTSAALVAFAADVEGATDTAAGGATTDAGVAGATTVSGTISGSGGSGGSGGNINSSELAQLRSRAAAMATHCVSVWRIADDNLVRYPVGVHDGPTRAVGFLPASTLSRVAGGVYGSGSGAYNVVSGGEDETVRLWSYAKKDLDVTRSEKSPLQPVQIIERPFFLRAMVDDPTLAKQGAVIRGEDGTSETTTTNEAKSILSEVLSNKIELKLTPAQQAAKDAEEARLKARKQLGAEITIHRESTIAFGPKIVTAKPGTKMKQLNRMLATRSVEPGKGPSALVDSVLGTTGAGKGPVVESERHESSSGSESD